MNKVSKEILKNGNRFSHTDAKYPRMKNKENRKRIKSSDRKQLFYDYEDLKQLVHGNYAFGGLGPNFNEDWQNK